MAGRRQQGRHNDELDEIIVEFGLAMKSANYKYIADPPHCHHDSGIRFTPRMQAAWDRYVLYCRKETEVLV
jgi:hypothetical protein